MCAQVTPFPIARSNISWWGGCVGVAVCLEYMWHGGNSVTTANTLSGSCVVLRFLFVPSKRAPTSNQMFGLWFVQVWKQHTESFTAACVALWNKYNKAKIICIHESAVMLLNTCPHWWPVSVWNGGGVFLTQSVGSCFGQTHARPRSRHFSLTCERFEEDFEETKKQTFSSAVETAWNKRSHRADVLCVMHGSKTCGRVCRAVVSTSSSNSSSRLCMKSFSV